MPVFDIVRSDRLSSGYSLSRQSHICLGVATMLQHLDSRDLLLSLDLCERVTGSCFSKFPETNSCLAFYPIYSISFNHKHSLYPLF